MNMDYRKLSAKADKEHRGEWVESDDDYRRHVEEKKRSKGTWVEDKAEHAKSVARAKKEKEAKQKEARRLRYENNLALKSAEERIAPKYACERSFQSMKVFLPNDVVEFHIGKKTLFRHSNKQCYPMELDEFLARLKV